MKRILMITLALSFWLCGQAISGEPIVVVNKDVNESNFSEDTVKNIFLGKKTKWSNGELITPVILAEGPVHKSFVKNYTGKNDRQFANHWKKMIFTGQGTSLKAFTSEAELIDFVHKTPGSIGYIDSGTPYDGVKFMPIK